LRGLTMIVKSLKHNAVALTATRSTTPTANGDSRE